MWARNIRQEPPSEVLFGEKATIEPHDSYAPLEKRAKVEQNCSPYLDPFSRMQNKASATEADAKPIFIPDLTAARLLHFLAGVPGGMTREEVAVRAKVNADSTVVRDLLSRLEQGGMVVQDSGRYAMVS